MLLQNAVVFDIETYPNCFTFHMEMLNSELSSTWEISHFRDDRAALLEWLNWIANTQTPMIGFNNIHFDYPVVHYLFYNPNATVEQIYVKAMEIIRGNDRFGNTIWADKRIAPQIDLFKIHHFDNKAKTTSLKALQVNMRSKSVEDLPIEVGTWLNEQQINDLLIPYNKHDVKETKQFAHFSMDAIRFRLDLIPQFGVDVMNYNDTKIGEKILESRIPKDLLYDYSGPRRRMRQTPRHSIALNDIIFPYVQFEHPEFNHVLNFLRTQVLKAEEINSAGEEKSIIKTKGVFTDLKAHVGGIDFCFGVGGIHGSVNAQRVYSTDEWIIRDIDVASLYPNIAIQNQLSPEHLGHIFVQEYAKLPMERKEWQDKKGKKCVEANSLKLAANGTYGKSNSVYSVFYDPKLTMSITVNGQLMLCMLAERLVNVPTLRVIQINTDGITYQIHRDHLPHAQQIEKDWQTLTHLKLEDVQYKRMWIRDVNNYIAEDMDGNLKQKGAYWHPDPLNYVKSISESQPPAWHKDLGNCISIRAAVMAMVHDIPPEHYIRAHTDPYDFMHRVKVGRADMLLFDGKPTQKTGRYYVSTDGGTLVKQAPPKGVAGAYKKANGVSDTEYDRVMTETGGKWDARVCTKNMSRYDDRETNLQAGQKVTICNRIEDFRFDNINYDYYVAEARKLII